jgi:hypothetical protein
VREPKDDIFQVSSHAFRREADAAGGFMDSFDQALQVIAGIMRDGVAKHPDNEWVRRTIEYHVSRAEEHLRLQRDGEQLEDHLAHATTRLLMALTLREIG